jgi:hypothetical protein
MKNIVTTNIKWSKNNIVLIGSLPMNYVCPQINLNATRIGITTKITPPKTFTCKIINPFYLTYPHRKGTKHRWECMY